MRRSICFCAPSAVICLALAFASRAIAAAEDAVGNWKDTETGAICSIYSCGGGICIKVVRPAKEFEKDTNNPNPSLRGRSMAGVTIMSGASKAVADRWKGQLYNGEDGGTYTGYITVTGKDEVKLEGCVLGGIICKSRVWRRAQ
jgi:uncharacterized protein (DUF2147 family)